MEVLEEAENLEAGACVEVSRGLVGQYDGGVVHQCAGDGHALHLSAGHLVALVVQSVAQAYGFQCFDGCLLALAGGVGLVVHQRQLDILHGCGLGQQVIVLEDEAYLAVSQDGAFAATHSPDGRAVQDVFAAGGRVQASELVEQGALAGA